MTPFPPRKRSLHQNPVRFIPFIGSAQRRKLGAIIRDAFCPAASAGGDCDPALLIFSRPTKNLSVDSVASLSHYTSTVCESVAQIVVWDWAK